MADDIVNELREWGGDGDGSEYDIEDAVPCSMLREAADEIARGNEAAQRVRALADRTVVETLSEAEREANVARGEADARRNNIFAQAYGADPEFFSFYRSLQAYERAIQAGNSTMVITPDSDFFNYLGAVAGRPKAD